MLTPIALLLATIAAAPNDWVEFPTDRPFPDHHLFAKVESAKDLGGGKFALDTVSVGRNIYTELTVTVDCTARTLTYPDGAPRLRHNNQENGRVVASTFALDKAGSYRAPAEWLCGGRQPAGLSGRNRVSGDPKPRAWREIDAFDATLPNRLSTELGKAAPHLQLRMDGVTTAITSARSDCGFFYFTLADGRSAKLDLMLNSPNRRTRSIYFDRVNIVGFTAEEFAFIDYALQWTPSCK